jgi:hypothetical protein
MGITRVLQVFIRSHPSPVGGKRSGAEAKPRYSRFVDPKTLDAARVTLALRTLQSHGGDFPFMRGIARQRGGSSSSTTFLLAGLAAVAALGKLLLIIVG